MERYLSREAHAQRTLSGRGDRKRKQTPVLIIDEASLLRLEVFAQLHTIGQFDMDSKPLLPMILAGQNNLLDKLSYITSRPLASRVIGRSHLEGLKQRDMAGYLKHHLEIAGIQEQLFSDEAILAIHQGSGGLLRRANLLAKGALIAAAREKCMVVSAEHVRMASTEIFLKKSIWPGGEYPSGQMIMQQSAVHEADWSE